MDPHIIFEDSHILALNKPSGLTVHPDGAREMPTLTDWVARERGELKGVGEALVLSDGRIIERPGIVHRLDKDTSGVMLLAKNQDAYLFLKSQFQEHRIKKTYKAIVYGNVKDDAGTIDFPIGRSGKDFRLKSAGPNVRGKTRDAVTEYKTISRTPEYSYIEAFPKTGRMHQIRAHFKAINHPIVCDPLYAPKRTCPNPPGRLALHAASIEFTHPEGPVMRIEAPLARELEGALTELGLL